MIAAIKDQLTNHEARSVGRPASPYLSSGRSANQRSSCINRVKTAAVFTSCPYPCVNTGAYWPDWPQYWPDWPQYWPLLTNSPHASLKIELLSRERLMPYHQESCLYQNGGLTHELEGLFMDCQFYRVDTKTRNFPLTGGTRVSFTDRQQIRQSFHISRSYQLPRGQSLQGKLWYLRNRRVDITSD